MYSKRESLNIQSAKIGGRGITIKTIDNCLLQLNSSIFCIIDVSFLWQHADTSSFLVLSELSSGWQFMR